VRAQRVPGDQHRKGVKVTTTGPGYRLRVVDGSPRSTEHTHLNTPPATAGFPPRNTARSQTVWMVAEKAGAYYGKAMKAGAVLHHRGQRSQR